MNKEKFIPANMPGCQMMSNLKFTPAQPELNRCQMNFIPVSSSSLGPQGVTHINNEANLQARNVPASIGIDAPLVNQKVQKYKQNNFKLSWWENNSFFNYNSILVSAYYGMKWKKDFRKFFNIPDNFIIIGDSGGFQNMTQDANLNCLEVLRWQEQNCNIGLTFDLPIMGLDDIKTKKEKQIKTVENAYYALNNRKNDKLKLYAVFQGHSIQEQQFILNEYKKQGDLNKFDGFAIGGLVPISTNIDLLIKVLCGFINMIKDYNKPLHFFGISGLKIIPLIAYIQTKVNFNITFDSSSYGGGAIRKEYWLDYSRSSFEFSDKNMTDIKQLPCNCPVCSKCSVEDMKKFGSISGGLIALHNLYQTISYVKQIYSLVEDKDLFLRYIKTNYSEDYLKYFDYIDLVFDQGLDFANNKYGIIEHRTTKQKTIFD